MASVILAGTLEKKSLWRKEWNERFCVVRRTCIDYFLETPAIVDDESSASSKRGTISLFDAYGRGAVAVEEPSRPIYDKHDY